MGRSRRLGLSGILFVTTGFLGWSPLVMGQAVFTPLGDLPGGSVFSKATGVSDDGRYVGGASVGSAEGFTPLRWDGTTPQPLALPGNFTLGAEVNDISGDGQWVVGMGPSGPEFEGLRWQPDGTPVVTGTILPGWSSANSVNRNGTVITGFDGLDFFDNSTMFRWTPGGGEQALGDLPGGASFSNGTPVSNDGSVIGGYGSDALGHRPVTWTESGNFQVLATVPGGTGRGRVIGVSHDGTAAVGEAQVGAPFLPARWAGGAAQLLGTPPVGYTVGNAFGSNADGSKVVGIWRETEFSDELESVAFIWDPVNGARLLEDALLADHGLSLPGWTLNMVTDITPDGLTMVGYGLNPAGDFEAYKVTVPEPLFAGLAMPAALLLLRARRRPRL